MLITAPAGTPAFWRARIALMVSRWEVHDSTICSVAQRFLTRASAVENRSSSSRSARPDGL